ncbi:LPS translocon maturation chaperone LptM [Terasakiispira papahanaumokuakeensis]
MRILPLLLLMLFAISGCGQKGPLYMPSPAPLTSTAHAHSS